MPIESGGAFTTTPYHHDDGSMNGEVALSPMSNNSLSKKSPSSASLSSSHNNDDMSENSDEFIQQTNHHGETGGSHLTMREMACNYVFGNCKALVYGQFLSLFLAATGAIQSSLYLDCRLSAPTFSMFTFYFPLSIITLSRLIYQTRCNSSAATMQQLPPSYRDNNDGDVQQLQQNTIECQACRALQNRQITTTTVRTKKKKKKRSSRTRIRAKPEKRNHLLSHWSTQVDSADEDQFNNDQFNRDDDDNDAGYLIASNSSSNNNSICSTCQQECSEQRTSLKTTKHSLFWIIPLKCNPFLYAAVAVTDVYANYATILAFKYTTLTSVSLFDALAIPSAIILSRLAFGRRYTKTHMLGVIVCSIGITINALQDYREDKELELSDDGVESDQEELIEVDYPHKMFGDSLAIIGGILFGIDNTLQEVAVREWGTQLEYLGCMTTFATIISFLQTLILERNNVIAFFQQSDSEACPRNAGLFLLTAFSIGGMLNYLGISAFLRISDAAFLNLSLLTGDAWAVLYSVYAEHIYPPGTFYVALVIVVSGVFIYETAPSPVAEKQAEARDDIVGEIQLVENRSNQSETTSSDGRVFV